MFSNLAIFTTTKYFLMINLNFPQCSPKSIIPWIGQRDTSLGRKAEKKRRFQPSEAEER